MSESNEVEVGYGENQTETAQNLLAAAERLGHPANVVRTTSEGHFLVPEDVAKDAGAYSAKSGDDGDSRPAAKKATAKKSTSRKPAKKAAAKKAPTKKAASSPEPTPTPDAPKSEGTNTETQE